MPAPRMPWEPEPPQPAMAEDSIDQIVKQIIPQEESEEQEED